LSLELVQCHSNLNETGNAKRVQELAVDVQETNLQKKCNSKYFAHHERTSLTLFIVLIASGVSVTGFTGAGASSPVAAA
jgi:hypothetical protein